MTGDATGAVIVGSLTAGLLSSVIGADNAAKTSKIVDVALEFGGFLSDIPRRYEEQVTPILDNLESATADAKALTAEVRSEDWPRWSGQVDEIMTWATEFTGRLDEAVAEGHALLSDGRGVVDENRDQIGLIVDNTEAASEKARVITARVEAETVDRANRLLETGQTALESASGTLQRLQTDYEGWSVDFGETVGNAALASQQLKLAAIEVRRSPWKLLYRPSEREIEHELLYDAARSFALAAADLKAASKSVQAVLDRHTARLADDPELLDRLRRNLVEPLQNYEQAQTRLLDVLLEYP